MRSKSIVAIESRMRINVLKYCIAMLAFATMVSRGFAMCRPTPAEVKLDTVPPSSIVVFTADTGASDVIGYAADGTVLRWDITHPEPSVVIDCERSVQALALTKDKKLLVAGDAGGNLDFVNLDRLGYPRVRRRVGDGIDRIRFAPDEKTFLVLQRHTLALWSRGQKIELWSRNTSQNLVEASFRSDGRRIAVSTGSGISIFNSATGEQIRHMEMPEVAPLISDLAYADDNKFLVAALDSDLVVLDPDTGKRTETISGGGGQIAAMTLLDDGKQAITVGDDNTLRRWNLTAGTLIDSWRQQSPGLVTNDGKYLINTQEQPGEIDVWEIGSRTRMRTLRYKSPLSAAWKKRNTP